MASRAYVLTSRQVSRGGEKVENKKLRMLFGGRRGRKAKGDATPAAVPVPDGSDAQSGDAKSLKATRTASAALDALMGPDE